MKSKELRKACEVTSGQSAPQDPNCFGKIGKPFVRAGNLEFLVKGDLEENCQLISDDIANELRLRLYPKDTILFAKSGMSAKLDRIYRLKKPAYVVSHLAAIIPGDEVHPGYLQRWFEKHPPSDLIPNNGYPSIRISDIGSLTINLPPYDEQKRVALILDKANTIRHKRQQTINLADQFLRSIFLEIFGDPITNPNNWEMKNLSELVDPARPITYGVLKAGPNYPSGVPLLKIQNIKGQKVINNNLHNITPELSQKYKRTILKGGEIIISLVGTIGRVAIIPNSLKGANIHRNFGLIAPNNLTNSCYLFHFLSLPHFKLILARSIKGGIQNLLNLNDLKRIKIPTPPKELIDSFETIVAKLDSFNGKTDNFKSHAENLYGSLCQRTFHGEL